MKYFLLLTVLLISGCVQTTQNTSSDVYEQMCIAECKLALKSNVDLSEGPCLLDPIPETTWVCDVAHNPRQSADNQPENQCDTYRSGFSRNFVEVTPDCTFIRTG